MLSLTQYIIEGKELEYPLLTEYSLESRKTYDARKISLKKFVSIVDTKLLKNYISQSILKQIGICFPNYNPRYQTFIFSDFILRINPATHYYEYNKITKQNEEKYDKCSWLILLSKTPENLENLTWWQYCNIKELDVHEHWNLAPAGDEIRLMEDGQSAKFYLEELVDHIKTYIPTTQEYKQSK